MKYAVCLLLFVFLVSAFCVPAAEPVFAESPAPVAENFQLTTNINTSYEGKLSAYDPDEDVVGFEITTSPVKGDIELSEDGSFVYTPRENKKGRDYFGYKAYDAQGNYSQEATVIIKIKNDTDI